MKQRYLLALAMAACASSAQADTGTAYAKLSNLSITQFDANPSDGLSPSFEILQTQAITSVNAYVMPNPAGPVLGLGFFTPLSQTSTGTDQIATAKTDATGFELSTTAYGQNYALGASAASNDGNSFSHTINIRVDPGTGLTVSGNVTLAVASHCDPGLAGFCASLAGVNAKFDLGDFANATPYSAFITSSQNSSTGSNTFTGLLNATYINTTDHVQELSLSVSGYASTSAPVDEPEILGTVMAGLFAVGLIRKAKGRLNAA